MTTSCHLEVKFLRSDRGVGPATYVTEGEENFSHHSLGLPLPKNLKIKGGKIYMPDILKVSKLIQHVVLLKYFLEPGFWHGKENRWITEKQTTDF